MFSQAVADHAARESGTGDSASGMVARLSRATRAAVATVVRRMRSSAGTNPEQPVESDLEILLEDTLTGMTIPFTGVDRRNIR